MCIREFDVGGCEYGWFRGRLISYANVDFTLSVSIHAWVPSFSTCIYVCPVMIKISYQCVTSCVCLRTNYSMCLTMNYCVFRNSHLCPYDFACDCIYYCKKKITSRNYAYLFVKDVCHIWAHAPEILRISFRTLVYGDFCALRVIHIYFCEFLYVILCLHVCFTIFVCSRIFVW